MRKKFALPHRLILFFTLLGLGACSLDDDGGAAAKTNIVQLIADSPGLSRLNDALVRAELVTTLQTAGSITIMAPDNTAFDVFLATAGFASIDDVPVPVLRQVLLNHVIGARVDGNTMVALGKNYLETLADGPASGTKLALFFDATEGAITFNGLSELKDADIPASNGVLHLVDAVIDLPTLETFVRANDGFEQLTLALTTATPGTDFMATLSATGPFTLFAPADVAFDDLLDTNPSWNTVDDIEEGLLTAVLQHHVIEGNVRSAGITDGGTAETLEGDSITFDKGAGSITLTDGSGNTDIRLVVADIQAINGVLHALDKVMLPDTTN